MLRRKTGGIGGSTEPNRPVDRETRIFFRASDTTRDDIESAIPSPKDSDAFKGMTTPVFTQARAPETAENRSYTAC
jgi:hypothetical protein